MKKFLCVATAAIICCSALSLSACKEEDQKAASYFMPVASYSQYKSSGSTMAQGYGYVMGTDAFLNIADADNFAEEERYNDFLSLWEGVRQVLTEVENSISVTIPTSCISRFNAAPAGSSVEIDETAYKILSLAKTVYLATDGYFNPAVYQSVRAYGFGTTQVHKPETLPKQETVEQYKILSESFAELSLTAQAGKYYAVKPATTVKVDGVTQSLMLDLGGIGKGWCADRVNELIDEAGFEYGNFYLGSSTVAIKSHPTSNENKYTITIGDPRSEERKAYAKFRTKNVNLSTSGDNEQSYIVDGVRYCHIINPTTGSPIQTGVASVTIVGGSAAEGDALTTALSAMGKQKAVEFINNNLSDKLVLMLVFEGGQGKVVTNQPDGVTVLNEAYVAGNTVEEGKIVLN